MIDIRATRAMQKAFCMRCTWEILLFLRITCMPQNSLLETHFCAHNYLQKGQ